MNNYTQCTTLHVHWGGAYKCTIPNKNAPKCLHANLSKVTKKGEKTYQSYFLFSFSFFFLFYNHKKIKTSNFLLHLE